jgi:tetratricopeptide (TPR) repeat protein
MNRCAVWWIGVAAFVLSGCGGCDDKALEEKARPYFKRGLSLEQDRQYSSAMKDYERAAEIYPRYREAYFQMGNVCEKLGVLDKARHYYEMLIDIDDDYAAAYNNLGNVLGQLGHLDSAIVLYEKCLELDPNNPSTHFNLSHALMLKRRMDEAERHLRQAVELAPLETKYRKAAGEFYLSHERFSEALPLLETAAGADTSDTAVLLQLSRIHEGLRHFDEAIGYLQRYLAQPLDQQERLIVSRRLSDLKTKRIRERLSEQRRRAGKE